MSEAGLRILLDALVHCCMNCVGWKPRDRGVAKYYLDGMLALEEHIIIEAPEAYSERVSYSKHEIPH
jgi:hypothetical protein